MKEYYWNNTGILQEYCIVCYMCSDSEAVVSLPSAKAKHRVILSVFHVLHMFLRFCVINALWDLKLLVCLAVANGKST